MNSDIVKACKKHGELKAEEAYITKKVYLECKYCKKEYRQTNREKMLRQFKEYQQANKERIKLWKKEYYNANKERIRQYFRKYREANQERISEKAKEYRQVNKKRIIEKWKKYYETNKEAIKEHNSKYSIRTVLNLHTKYVKQNFMRKNKFLKGLNIPDELIKYERAKLLLKRRLKDQPTLGE